jgi:hypothetical protein
MRRGGMGREGTYRMLSIWASRSQVASENMAVLCWQGGLQRVVLVDLVRSYEISVVKV